MGVHGTRVFESGFSGFPGLIITSPVWVERLFLNGASIARPLADVLHIGEKKGEKQSSTKTHYTHAEDVLFNPENPENPDSKPDESG